MRGRNEQEVRSWPAAWRRAEGFEDAGSSSTFAAGFGAALGPKQLVPADEIVRLGIAGGELTPLGAERSALDVGDVCVCERSDRSGRGSASLRR